MKRDILERPFDKALVKTRQGSFGRELAYVEARHYIERLNEAFDGAWHFEVALHEILPDEVLVLGTLKAGGITKQAFGGSSITRNRQSGEALSIADDLKAAATDSLKKAASLFGIGLHLYGDDSVCEQPAGPNGNGRALPADRRGTPDQRQPDSQPPPRSNGNGANGNGGNGDGRLTARQLSAIWGLARQHDIAQREVRRVCMADFGRQPEFLSKSEASAVIDRLQAVPHAAHDV